MNIAKLIFWIVIIYLLMGVVSYFFMGGESMIDILTWPKDVVAGFKESSWMK